jgi:hypothetical protein
MGSEALHAAWRVDKGAKKRTEGHHRCRCKVSCTHLIATGRGTVHYFSEPLDLDDHESPYEPSQEIIVIIITIIIVKVLPPLYCHLRGLLRDLRRNLFQHLDKLLLSHLQKSTAAS